MQAGAKANDTTTKLVLNYLNIPLFLKVKIGPVFGLVGSGVNFKLSESGDAGSTEKASGVDVPLFLGAGVKIFFLTIEARYAWGLVNLYNSGGIKNQYLQVGAAVSF